jgi:hypothetical protein
MAKLKPTLADTGSIVPRIQTAYLWEQLAAKPNSRVTEMGRGNHLQWVVQTNQGSHVVYATHSSRIAGLVGAIMLLQTAEFFEVKKALGYRVEIGSKGFAHADFETAILSAYAMSLEEVEPFGFEMD